MSTYSSREPFNVDPNPWIVQGGIGRASDLIHDNPTYAKFHTSREPRPEYDRPQNNPTNPILTVLRRPEMDIYDLLLSLNSRWARQFSLAEENHARKVLTRLAALKEES